MKKKVIAVLIVCLALLLAMTVFACTDYNDENGGDDEQETVTRSQLITNGTFYNATSSNSDAYIKENVTGWTAVRGSLALGANGITMGVIDLANKESYALNRDKFSHDDVNQPFELPDVDPKTPYEKDDLGADTEELQDTNVLVIASRQDQGSLYYRNASSFTLDAGKYYKLQYSVITNVDTTSDEAKDYADKKGAWVHITGGVEYVDSCINTHGKWETHELYIESNKNSSITLDIRLWLGNGPARSGTDNNGDYNPYITRGAVMFDNIILTEITSVPDPTNDGNMIANIDHATFDRFATLKKSDRPANVGYETAYYLSDLNMEQMTETTPTSTNAIKYYYSYREGVYTSTNVKNYTLVKGKDDLSSSDAPSVTNAFTGIVDLSKLYQMSDPWDTSTTANAYSKLLPATYVFNAPSITDWYMNIMGYDITEGNKNDAHPVGYAKGPRGDLSSLKETKALMIYHNDLSGAGFKNKNSITIEANKYYKISVWAYVWAPVKDGGYDYPDSNAPKKPTDFTAAQKSIRDYYQKYNETEGNVFYGYFNDLTEEEKTIVAKSENSFDLPENYAAQMDAVLNSSAFMADLRAYFQNVLGYESAENPGDYNQTVIDSMKFLYLKGNAALANDNELKKADYVQYTTDYADYFNYRFLAERNNFLDKTFADVKDKIDEWADYEEDYSEWMSKYSIWGNLNQAPTAKVKLTGAGDDIEKETDPNLTNNAEGTRASEWQEITFYVRGNQLSSRKLNIEFWFGEGSATDYETLMFGGALFDNITVTEYDENSLPSDLLGKDWETLSPITDAEEFFGGLTTEDPTSDAPFEQFWKTEMAEGTASSDASKVTLTSEKNADIGSVDLLDKDDPENGPKTTIYLHDLVWAHTAPTASILKYRSSDVEEEGEGQKLITILPNTAYRFAMWVKTEGIPSGKGVNISLMVKDDKADSELSSASSVSSFNNEEWKEVVFYILGDSAETNYVGLQFSMGSGTRFSTDSYVQGKFYIAIINCTKIKYSEYNSSSKSGDQINSYSFSNTGTATDSVTNGSFSSLDYSNTDEKEFENGKLTGVGTPSSWTKSTAKNNTFNTITLEFDRIAGDTTSGNTSGSTSGGNSGEGDGGSGSTSTSTKFYLKWNTVVGIDSEGNDTNPTAYEIYARFNEDGDTVERLVEVIEAGSEDGDRYKYDTEEEKYLYRVDLAEKTATSFRVRAVSDDAVSSYSNYVTPGYADSDGESYVAEDNGEKKEINAGTVDSKESGLFEGLDGFADYVSPYKTALKIESNYKVAYGFTSSSKSLNSNTYYRVSVWVKTMLDAKASVTVSNISNILTADVDKNYIGFTGINTEGKWKQYAFYIQTGVASSSISLELSLGNKYAVSSSKTSELVTTAIATYSDDDLSMGAVYFDHVEVIEVDEDEYNARLAEGEYDENNDLAEHKFDYMWTNNVFYIKNLVYTADSFDSFTENTTAEDRDGYNLGQTPNNYDWAKAADSTGTSETERLYGVYNHERDAVEKLHELYYNTSVGEDEEDKTEVGVFDDFLPDDFDIREFIKVDGYNALVMSNKVSYGQSYTTTGSTTISANSYYKLTFKAKALVAKEVKGDDDSVSYVIDNVNAEFRYMPTGATDKYESILINSAVNASAVTDGKYNNSIYNPVEYTMYIYNPSASSSSAKWAFYIGANNDDEDDTGTKQFMLGMLVIDQVALTKITEEDYTAAKTSTNYDNISDADKLKAVSRFYSYDEDKEDETPSEEEPSEEETPKQTIWQRGEVWLLISSLVIAVVIIVVVVVIVVKRWKKKHPKEVVGENITQTQKDIKVVETPNEKEEFIADDEYSDVKPVVIQRVTGKSKKKKNKKK